MYAWSATLPQSALVRNFSMDLDANVDVFQPDEGEPITAPASPFSYETWNLTFRMSPAQRDEFRVAWKADIKNGALSFTGPDFMTGAPGPIKYKPVPRTKPKIAPIGTGRQFSVSFAVRRKV